MKTPTEEALKKNGEGIYAFAKREFTAATTCCAKNTKEYIEKKKLNK